MAKKVELLIVLNITSVTISLFSHQNFFTFLKKKKKIRTGGKDQMGATTRAKKCTSKALQVCT